MVSIVTSLAYTESSPLSVRFTLPRAPTKSPPSVRSRKGLKRSPSRFFSRYSCTVPELSCTVKKASLPKMRRVMMRPHTATSAASSSSPGGRASKTSLSSADLCVALYR